MIHWVTEIVQGNLHLRANRSATLFLFCNSLLRLLTVVTGSGDKNMVIFGSTITLPQEEAVGKVDLGSGMIRPAMFIGINILSWRVLELGKCGPQKWKRRCHMLVSGGADDLSQKERCSNLLIRGSRIYKRYFRMVVTRNFIFKKCT